MKNFTFTLVAIFALAFAAQARIITVNNLGGAEYDRLDSARAAANSGDTLYLEPTNLRYEFGFTAANPLNKTLTIVGVGFNPNTSEGFKTILNDLYLDTGASGSRFYGLTWFSSDVSIATASGKISDIYFQNCSFFVVKLSQQPVNQSVFRNCVFTAGRFNSANLELFPASDTSESSTITVENCVFHNGIEQKGNSGFNNLFINHCIFVDGNALHLNGIKNALITNSIFSGSSTIGASSTGNIFANNIFPNRGSLSTGNAGSGNLFLTNPQFVNYSLNSSFNPASNPSDQNKDLALLPTSPGVGAATDGTDIGIHGGNNFFSETGETLWLPIVRSVDFLGAAVPQVQPGDTLQVQINATRPALD